MGLSGATEQARFVGLEVYARQARKDRTPTLSKPRTAQAERG
jgi:hypothetical protein